MIRKGNENDAQQIAKIKIDNYTWKDTLAINIYKGKEAEPKILYKNSNRIKIYSGFEK